MTQVFLGWPHPNEDEILCYTIFTARKRSLRRLCFYTCQSFCSGGAAAYPSMQWANGI